MSLISMASMSIDIVSTWAPLLLLLVLVFLMKKMQMEFKKHKKQLLLPPGPPQLPIIGNLHQLRGLVHISLMNLSLKYGPLMHLKLGSVPTLVVSSAEAAREVLKAHDLESATRPSFAGTGRHSYDYHDVAFAPYGDYWRQVRKLFVMKMLSAKRVESFASIREEEVESLIDSISQSSSPEVNLTREMFTTTANIVFRVAFGNSFRRSGADSPKYQKLLHEAACMLESFCASDFFPRMGWIVDRLTGLQGRLERCFRDLDALYQQIIDEHKNPNRKIDEEDIVDVLLKMTRDEGECGDLPFQLNEVHIKAIIMNVFVGGVDNNSISMTWVMTELAKNPRVMKKVQDEIRTHVKKKGRVSESDIQHFKYFNMVIKETFRLHPVIVLPNETVSHFKANGYDVPPKTLVLVNGWAIGRDPNVWERPEEFYPERFEDSPVDFKGKHFELLPFGGGRRICPGITFGMALLELALANLLYCFDWKLPNGMKEEDISMDEATGLSVQKKLPLKLVPLRAITLMKDNELCVA